MIDSLSYAVFVGLLISPVLTAWLKLLIRMALKAQAIGRLVSDYGQLCWLAVDWHRFWPVVCSVLTWAPETKGTEIAGTLTTLSVKHLAFR